MSEKKRRIVTGATETVRDALEARKERLKAKPTRRKEYKPLSEVAQLERSLYQLNMSLNKYELLLEDGEELSPEQERVMMQLNDQARKAALTLSALRAKEDLGKKKDDELALGFLETGMEPDQVRALFEDNRRALAAIDEWENARD